MEKLKVKDPTRAPQARVRSKSRSRTNEAKAIRKAKIKSTTLNLFLQKSELPAVDQIVQKAHMAKGTFYLYYETREEVFLEILQDMYQQAFCSLTELFRAKPKMTIEEFASLVVSYFEEHQEFLLLAALSPTILESNVMFSRLLSFKQNLANEMIKLSEWVSPVRNDMSQSQILAAMTLTFATMIGIWQQSAIQKSHHRLRNHPECCSLLLDFSQAARLAISALWRGMKFETTAQY